MRLFSWPVLYNGKTPPLRVKSWRLGLGPKISLAVTMNVSWDRRGRVYQQFVLAVWTEQDISAMSSIKFLVQPSYILSAVSSQRGYEVREMETKFLCCLVEQYLNNIFRFTVCKVLWFPTLFLLLPVSRDIRKLVAVFRSNVNQRLKCSLSQKLYFV
jgi:hypothetical protein